MIRRLLPALLLCVAASGAAQADERIQSWDSAIRVRADSRLEVVETLAIRSEGRQIRHGILRDFPTRYTDRRGNRVVTGFKVLEVTRDGQPEPYRLERLANGVRIRIGNAEATLPDGTHLYQIVYRSDRQLGFFDSRDELYWNVTGNGWNLPIDFVRARVTLPGGIPAERLELEAYTGPQGATGRHWEALVDVDAPVFTTTRPLGPYEGLTIVVGWPKGYVSPPTGWQRLAYMLRDAWPAFVAVGGLLLLLLYYQRAWAAVGRDPPGRIVVPQYEAPPGLSPAAMRYLTRMRYDQRCFVAAILGLALKGRLTIAQEPKGFLGRGGKFTLVRRSPAGDQPLADDERELLQLLFTGGDTLELDDKNHTVLTKARIRHESVLREAHTPRLFRNNRGWHAAGIGLSILIGALAVGLPLASGGFGPLWLFGSPAGWTTLAAVVAAFVANLVFGWLLKAPTLAGRALIDRIRGFGLYLDVAEGSDLALIDGPLLTPALYERNLPAAFALGVEQNWAERFAAVFATQGAAYSPAWYHGDSWNPTDIGRFSSGFSSSFSSAVSSASSPPGSSSGGGGGGSSGGGGGGGGGGGW